MHHAPRATVSPLSAQPVPAIGFDGGRRAALPALQAPPGRPGAALEQGAACAAAASTPILISSLEQSIRALSPILIRSLEQSCRALSAHLSAFEPPAEEGRCRN
jgi:hypothetical protein